MKKINASTLPFITNIDTNEVSFDIQQIENSSFMYQPQTGTLRLSSQNKSNEILVSSHEEEYGENATKEPFDSIQGWIRKNKEYPNGIIYFSPQINTNDKEYFEKGLATLEMFKRNNANNNAVVRGFGDTWEQPLNNLINITERSNKMNVNATVQPVTLATKPPQSKPATPFILSTDNPTEKIKELTDHLEQGIAELFESERYKTYLEIMSKFYTYSPRNTMLIYLQKPEASLVGGYSFWKKELERNVKKGEKGIKIIAPSPYKVKKEMEKIDPKTQRPIIGKDGKPVMKEQEITINSYKVVSIFDVSQTEGKELPSIGVDALIGNVEQYNDFFSALKKISPVPIVFEKMEKEAKGYYSLKEKHIALLEGASELQTLKTLIHEIAHAKLHDIDMTIPQVDSRTQEVEAESIAYTVCKHYGLDTSDYSFGYIAMWSSNNELAELKSSLKTIQRTVSELINSIDAHIAEIQKEQIVEKGQTDSTPKKQTEIQQTHHDNKNQSELTSTTNNALDNANISSNDMSANLTEKSDSVQMPEEKTQQETKTKDYSYSINEETARRAKEANSFSDYNTGSATAEYNQYIYNAIKIAEKQKSIVDPMYYEKIDRLLDTYSRKIAENMNNSFAIEARVPSIMITGGSNFPTRQKENQNDARAKNYEEFENIEKLLETIKSIGMGGISSDDPNVTQKLESKIADLEQKQENMKAVNVYYRKHKTLDNCPLLSLEQIEKLKDGMIRFHQAQPFESFKLSNNNAEIRRLKSRIKQLSDNENYIGWQFKGGRVEANTEKNRLQIFFDEKPDKKICEELKNASFHWSPSAKAWQRQLNYHTIYDANFVTCIQPITGERPLDLQHAHILAKKAREQVEENQQTTITATDHSLTGETVHTLSENPLATAEKSTEQNNNIIEGRINNIPVKDKDEVTENTENRKSIIVNGGMVAQVSEIKLYEKTEKLSILAQLNKNKEKVTPKKDTKNKVQNLERC